MLAQTYIDPEFTNVTVTILDVLSIAGTFVQIILLLSLMAIIWDILRTIQGKRKAITISAPTFWINHSIAMLCICAPLRFFSDMVRAVGATMKAV